MIIRLYHFHTVEDSSYHSRRIESLLLFLRRADSSDKWQIACSLYREGVPRKRLKGSGLEQKKRFALASLAIGLVNNGVAINTICRDIALPSNAFADTPGKA